MLISKLTLYTSDLKGTLQFYTEVLGLKLHQKEDTSVSFMAGESILKFIHSAESPPCYHFAFTIPSNKIREALTAMEGRVTPLIDSDLKKIVVFGDWKAKSFYFMDNNENILEFIAREEMLNATTAAFDTDQICSVSEIGIAVAHVPAACEHLKKQYGLLPYSGQKPSEQFTALGDAGGLLLLVREGRTWFPTKCTAKKATVEIEIRHREQIHVLKYH